MMQAKLTFTKGPWNSKIVTLSNDVVYFGRGRQSEIRIDDDEVSSQHFRISKTSGNVFYIEDIGSRNGTYLNNSKLPINEKNALHDGDSISAGKSIITFETYSKKDSATFTLATSDHVSLQDISQFKSNIELTSQTGSVAPTLVNNTSWGGKVKADHNSLQALPRAKADETIQSTIQPEFHQDEVELTEQTAGISSLEVVSDPEVTMVGHSQGTSTASKNKIVLASSGSKLPSKTMLFLYIGLAACVIFLLLLALASRESQNQTQSSVPIAFAELVLTCPEGWQQCPSNELLHIEHSGSRSSVIIQMKQKDVFLFSPLWGSPTHLSNFLQTHDVFTKEMARVLNVSSLPKINHITERAWYGGIKALDITFTTEGDISYFGQFALCRDSFVFCIAKKQNKAQARSPVELVDMLSWIRINPPRDCALYPRPVLLIPPFDAQERFAKALESLNGISSLVEKGPEVSDSVDVIRHYRLAFAVLAESSISPSAVDMVERHYLHFTKLLEKRRETLSSMKGTVLLKQQLGDYQGALDEADRLYNDARQTDDRSYMEWAWMKMAEIGKIRKQ